jgi:hypothetical protein
MAVASDITEAGKGFRTNYSAQQEVRTSTARREEGICSAIMLIYIFNMLGSWSENIVLGV